RQPLPRVVVERAPGHHARLRAGRSALVRARADAPPRARVGALDARHDRADVLPRDLVLAPHVGPPPRLLRPRRAPRASALPGLSDLLWASPSGGGRRLARPPPAAVSLIPRRMEVTSGV